MKIKNPISQTRTVAIVQARTGSTRLPGKVLMEVAGDTVLGRVVHRLRRAELIEEIVIATTTAPSDDAIVQESRHLGVRFYRGSEMNVLDRYYQTVREFGAEVIARITSDCPLIDPELVDGTVQMLSDRHADYASNVFPRTYPRGLDVEVFTALALERAWRDANKDHQREHVTPYFYERPELFRLVSVTGHTDYSRYRWTLDTAEDLELIRTIYSRFGSRDHFGWREVIALMESEPELAGLNSRVLKKSLHGN